MVHQGSVGDNNASILLFWPFLMHQRMHCYHTSSGTSSFLEMPTGWRTTARGCGTFIHSDDNSMLISCHFFELKVEANNCTPQKNTRQGAVENYTQQHNDTMSLLEVRLTPRANPRQGAAEEYMRHMKESMMRINDTKEG